MKTSQVSGVNQQIGMAFTCLFLVLHRLPFRPGSPVVDRQDYSTQEPAANELVLNGQVANLPGDFPLCGVGQK
jgi:hypothetical protein